MSFAQASVVYYRRDVFSAHNLTVPTTWDDVLAVAAILNGSDFNADGAGDYALCFQTSGNCPESGVLLGQILAPLTQYQVAWTMVVIANATLLGHFYLHIINKLLCRICHMRCLVAHARALIPAGF